MSLALLKAIKNNSSILEIYNEYKAYVEGTKVEISDVLSEVISGNYGRIIGARQTASAFSVRLDTIYITLTEYLKKNGSNEVSKLMLENIEVLSVEILKTIQNITDIENELRREIHAVYKDVYKISSNL